MEPTAGETSRSNDVGMNFRAYLQVALLDSTQHGLTSESSRSTQNVDCQSLDLKPLRNRGCDVMLAFYHCLRLCLQPLQNMTLTISSTSDPDDTP